MRQQPVEGTLSPMNEPTLQQLLDVCIETAKTAGTHGRNNLHRREEIAEQFDHDVKLLMDSECQRVAERVIHQHFPDHAILGEEGSTKKENTFEWIIDPIDGTANYTRGLPSWCCSIAVRREDNILAGCVYVPVLDECYSASIESPARCNGKPIQAAATPTLKKSVIFTGLTKDLDPRALNFFTDVAPRCSKIRIIGSAAIDICHVACGRIDGYFEPGIYLWDVAAAGLIAQRAGAIVTEWPRDEEHGCRYLCAIPAIHKELKQAVQTHFWTH